MASLVIKKSAGGGIHIDEGKYTAVVESINVGKGQEGNEFLTWAFKVRGATIDDDPVKEDVRVVGFCNALLTPKSKLYKWAQGAGIDVTNEDEDEVDLQAAIGNTVRISVEDYETKDGATVSRVVKISPPKKSKKAKDEDEDEEEEKPAKKPAKEEKKPKKKAKPVDEDEDSEEEEEKPAKKPKKGAKDGKPAKKAKAEDEDDEDDDDIYDFDDDEDEDSDDDD